MRKAKKIVLPLMLFFLIIAFYWEIKPAYVNAESLTPIIYTVKKGDSLYYLSRRFNAGINDILTQNSSITPENLTVGSKIKIPQTDNIWFHTVKPGDNLWQISKMYNSNIMTIWYKNFITNPDLIFVNDILAIPRTDVKSAILEVANRTILAIKNQNMVQLSKLVHPETGVRFTPYSYIDINRDLVFNKLDVSNFTKNTSKYTWGVYDGTGDPIIRTPKEYFGRFVYDKDFINAPKITYNMVVGTGNTLENQFEIYTDSIIVEYYIPGNDPRYGGMDWKSLRLVFKKYGASWHLTGVIHNEWTT